jgi:hypothetical protein
MVPKVAKFGFVHQTKSIFTVWIKVINLHRRLFQFPALLHKVFRNFFYSFMACAFVVQVFAALFIAL